MSGCPPRFFFFNDTATTEIYTLSLHDALPIFRANPEHYEVQRAPLAPSCPLRRDGDALRARLREDAADLLAAHRSEEHTSELQSRQYLVCRLLLDKKITLIPSSARKTHLSI